MILTILSHSYSIQPNPATLAQQLNLWTALVMSWAKHERVFEVNCDAVDGGGEVFFNRSINSEYISMG